VPRRVQVRVAQAARRKVSTRKTLSAEVDKTLLAEFRAVVRKQRLRMREAVEAAMRNWIKPITSDQNW